MTVIYHNPRCSKSRQALALLEERGIKPRIVEYLRDPLDVSEIDQLINRLGIDPHDLLRTKESAYREAGLSRASSRAEIVKAIAAHPTLLERPIVVHEDRAAIGRPPEKVLTIL